MNTAEFLLTLRLILAALLYLFLSAAFYILWRGLKQNERDAPSPPTPAQIVVEAGPDEGHRLVLRPITAIGRADMPRPPCSGQTRSAERAGADPRATGRRHLL